MDNFYNYLTLLAILAGNSLLLTYMMVKLEPYSIKTKLLGSMVFLFVFQAFCIFQYNLALSIIWDAFHYDPFV